LTATTSATATTGRGTAATAFGFSRSGLSFSLRTSSSWQFYGLGTLSRSRGLYGDRATREIYVVSLGPVLIDALLIGNVTSVANLLTTRAQVGVVALVADSD
jgi:hypothetical protein